MKFTKKRIFSLIVAFLIYSFIAFIAEYLARPSDINFYTIISIALVSSAGVTFSNEFIKAQRKRK